ncbi:MAG TPA: hypothetical protein GXX18_08515 [Bacillales bacterium]|nr:hypothetical protein [Bacillales bacterium]
MRIIFHECKKAFTSPIILALLILFCAYNIYLIYNSSYFKEELHVANELAETYGVNITDESLSKLDQDLKKDLAEINMITEKKSSQTFGSAAEFFNQLRFEDQELYTKDEISFFHNVYLKEMYARMAKTIDASYKKFDIERMGETEISKYGLSDTAADTLRKQYIQFADRFDKLQENREHKQWFFFGKQYFMHRLLFKTVFMHMILESIILIVLTTALITNYEFENRTHLVTYATKRGRLLMADKLAASLIAATGITSFLLMITLGAFFMVFDYSHLLKTAISSGFNWEYSFPNVSWWNISFLTYLFLGIVLSYACMLLFSAFTFAISVIIKNSYYTFILFGAIFVVLFLLQGFVPTSSKLIFITGFNLSTLVLNPYSWFMVNKGLLLFKHYELITVFVWTVIIVVLCIFCLKRFKKQAII